MIVTGIKVQKKKDSIKTTKTAAKSECFLT